LIYETRNGFLQYIDNRERFLQKLSGEVHLFHLQIKHF